MSLASCLTAPPRGTRVARVEPGAVVLSSGERLSSATVIWAAGVRGALVAEKLGLPLGRGGRIRVAPTLQVIGQPHVFAAGDVALLEEAPVPQLAQGAIQGGVHAAENVMRARRGQPLQPFRYYDKGVAATIGRSRAVAMIRGFNLSGRLAWWLWLAVHLVMLVGFRSRVVVLVDWAWNYLTYDRGLRAILGSSPADDPPAETTTGSAPEETLPARVAGGGFEPPTSRL